MRGGSGGAARVKARFAYLTGRTYLGAPTPPGAVPKLERVSRDLIAAACAARGIGFTVEYWDDESLPSRGYDAAIIRTCWDYDQRADEFLTRLQAHERAGLPVFNGAAVVGWNMRKTYLRDLGAAAIETVWAERADAATVAKAFDALDAAEIVLKPQVGGGARDTIRLKRNAWSEADLIAGPRDAAMIQPYLRAIETEGERSLFWFGGEFSHAIRKVPAAGAWLANMPGETAFVAETPPASAMAVAESARAASPADLLYVRIDIVLGDDNHWRVIEIEAIEPYLFLDFAPEGADRFAGAIARVLGV